MARLLSNDFLPLTANVECMKSKMSDMTPAEDDDDDGDGVGVDTQVNTYEDNGPAQLPGGDPSINLYQGMDLATADYTTAEMSAEEVCTFLRLLKYVRRPLAQPVC